MTNEEQSKRFYELLNTIKNLHDAKKHDYGAKEDIFVNFRLSALTGISPWKGSVVRMGDKYSRICSFIKNGDFKFKEENIKDTLLDMAIYSLITIVLYEQEMFDSHMKQFQDNMEKQNDGSSNQKS